MGEDSGSAFGALLGRHGAPRKRSRSSCAKTPYAGRSSNFLTASGGDQPPLRINGDTAPQSLEQIGRRMSLTRERVRQIEMNALQRLSMARELAGMEEAAA